MQGKTINGFTLQRQLGVGGMAEVWYAENRIGKKAAVKLLLPKLCQDENVVSRFLTEAKVMVALDHPNIRQVFDYGEIEGRPAIVMEYLDGMDLKTKLKRGQHFTKEELKHWWDQLVSALNYTHQKGIVHRDIKPGNIFVDAEGNIKLLDFGIAKVRESIGSTQTGQKLGTLMYMSPEQVKDSKHINYHTDIYSLAVTFVHLLTGKKPYDIDTSSDFEISEQIVYKPLDLSGVPMGWRSFLEPYLEKDPEKRPALRPFEVKMDARSYDDEDTIVGGVGKFDERPVSKPKPQPKPSKKKKGLWIGVGVTAVLAVVLLLFVLKPKEKTAQSDPDTEVYQACQTVDDYRNYISDYGRNAKHYSEAVGVIEQYVADSIQKVQQAQAAEEERQRVEAEKRQAEEALKAEDAAYKKCTTIEACDKYLKAYPQGRYVDEVKKKRAKLVEESLNNNAAMLPAVPSNYKGVPVAVFYFDFNSSSIKMNDENKGAISIISDLLSKYAIKGFEVKAYGESNTISSARADAVVIQLKNLVKKVNLNENSFSYKKESFGFDWEFLCRLIESSSIGDRDGIVRCLRNSSDKERELQTMNMIYPEIERQILPLVRRVEIYVY